MYILYISSNRLFLYHCVAIKLILAFGLSFAGLAIKALNTPIFKGLSERFLSIGQQVTSLRWLSGFDPKLSRLSAY